MKPWLGNTGLEFSSDFGAVIADVLEGRTALVTSVEGEFLLYLRATLQTVGPTQPPTQQVAVTLGSSPRVKRPEREADCSSAFSV